MNFKRKYLISGAVLVFAATALAVYRTPREIIFAALPDSNLKADIEQIVEPPIRRVKIKSLVASKIVAAAKTQIGDAYDASYQTISYPNGDVKQGQGACTDVVIRALRGAGFDLQKLIHDDKAANFATYPDHWKLGRTDKNIDHRRVPNHIAFFKRKGLELPIGTQGNDLNSWLPGDIVEWKLSGGRWHTGIISDGIGASGLPLVIHNGWECIEQDALNSWEIKAHFRFPAN